MSPLLTPDNGSDGHIQLAQFTRPRPQAPGCPVLGRSGRGRLILSSTLLRILGTDLRQM